jgi:hypothetical protein
MSDVSKVSPFALFREHGTISEPMPTPVPGWMLIIPYIARMVQLMVLMYYCLHSALPAFILLMILMGLGSPLFR